MTRFKVMLEKDALVGDVLVDDPEAFAIHGDDETRTDLSQRLQIHDLIGPRKRGGGVAIGRGKISGPGSRGILRWSDSGAERRARVKGEALLDGAPGRRGGVENGGRAGAGAPDDIGGVR